MKRILVVLTCVFSLLCVEEAHAENAKLDEIVVTATRTETQRSQIPGSVTVITDKDIEESHTSTISDLLRDVPGLDVVQQGGAGKVTSLFIRGGESRHTLVLIDGVKVNNPTTGGFDFADLSVDDIERIEIIRGPLSTLYGSDAIGGVIQIFTKRAKTSSATVGFEGGSYGTIKENISTEVKKEKYDLSLTTSRTDTTGFSQAKGGSENDGYQNTTISSHIGISPGAMSRIDITARLTESKADLDYGVDIVDDPTYQQQRRSGTVGITYSAPLTSKWEHKLTLSNIDDDLTTFDVDAADRYKIRTGIQTIDWQHIIQGNEGNLITLGYEWQQKKGEIEGAFNKSFTNHAIYLQEQRGIGSPVQFLTGARWDDSTIYESALTYRLGVSYLPVEGARWYTQYGTGFKGPSLNDLFWPGAGNPDLKPEKSSGWEVGVEQAISGSLSISVDYYRNVFDNLIQWVCDPSFNCKPLNRSRTDSNGVETALLWHLTSLLYIEGNYTYDDTEDRESHYYLQRRPLNKYTAIFHLNPAGRLQLNVNLVQVGKRVEWTDTNFDGTPDQQNFLSAYSKVDLLGSYKIGKSAEVFGRIENLFDKKYEEAKGYNTAGFSTYGGLKMSF